MIAQIIETLQILVWLQTDSSHFETVFAFANIKKKKKQRFFVSSNCKKETEAI